MTVAVRYPAGIARGSVAVLAAFALAIPCARGVSAQTISVSGNPGVMIVNSATAGSAPVSVTDNSTTLSLTTGGSGPRRVQARLASALPAGVTLTIAIQSPGGGAINQGTITLATFYRNVITNIDYNENATGLTITYTLTATSAAGVIALSSRNVNIRLN